MTSPDGKFVVDPTAFAASQNPDNFIGNIAGDLTGLPGQLWGATTKDVSNLGGYITGLPGDVFGWLKDATGIPAMLKFVEAFLVRVGNSFWNSLFFGTCNLFGIVIMGIGVYMIVTQSHPGGMLGAIKTIGSVAAVA